MAQTEQLPKIGLEFARLQRNVDVAGTVYSGILGALEAARSDRDMTTGNVQVAQAGTIPEAPVEPKPLFNIVLGLLCGGMLAVFAVALLEGGVRRIYTMNQVQPLLTGPIIGVLPLWSRRQQRAIAQGGAAPERLRRSALPVRDAYGRAGARLALACRHMPGTKPGSVVMVTSSTGGEGVSSVASQTAHQLALAGHAVILVDANFRRPTQHLRYGGDPNQGLIALLRDGGTADRTITASGVPKLQVVVTGDFTINDEALVGTDNMRSFLDYARSHSDFVIIDTQPCDTPVPILMSGLVDTIVQVVGLGKTSERALQEAQEALRAMGKPVVTIVNRASTSAGVLPPSRFVPVRSPAARIDVAPDRFLNGSDPHPEAMGEPNRPGPSSLPGEAVG
jgi:Mrp family chromosome partitioning ATPase